MMGTIRTTLFVWKTGCWLASLLGNMMICTLDEIIDIFKYLGKQHQYDQLSSQAWKDLSLKSGYLWLFWQFSWEENDSIIHVIPYVQLFL